MLPDDCIRVSVTWKPIPSSTMWVGEEAVTTWHMRLHHFTGNVFDWQNNMDTLPGRLSSKFADHWSVIGAVHPNNVHISEIKTAHLDPSGHTLHEGAFTLGAGDLTGGASASMMPPEVALCVSWWAYEPGSFAANKGRKRGRFYLPYIATSVSDSTGKVDATHLTALLAGYQAFINDVQGMHTQEDIAVVTSPDYFDWAIVSNVDATFHNADWVSIDDHFDSQRRRQHQTPANRSVLALSHS